MGFLLSQAIDGKECLVCCDSRKFTSAEQKWHIREKEGLAIIEGLEKFRRFILGRRVIIRTDHHSLSWLETATTGRLARWALRLSEYQPFTIQYRTGVTHTNVDAFTRVFAPSEGLPDACFACGLLNVTLDLPSASRLHLAQEGDTSCRKATTSKHTEIRQGLIGISIRGSWRPFLPESLLTEVVKAIHCNPMGAHLGLRRTLAVLRRYYAVNGLQSRVDSILKGCTICLQRKANSQRHGELSSRPPSQPWATVAMDFCGPYRPSDAGYKYVLVFTDHFTKWVELIPTRDMLATTVVDLFYTYIICRHGWPLQLLSDQGPQFTSKALETVCQQFGIKKVFSSTYYPQGDGYAERMMRTMNNSLSILTNAECWQWEKFLPGIAFAYNSTPHAAHKLTP